MGLLDLTASEWAWIAEWAAISLLLLGMSFLLATAVMYLLGYRTDK